MRTTVVALLAVWAATAVAFVPGATCRADPPSGGAEVHGVIRGFVFDVDGKPLAGVAVEASPETVVSELVRWGTDAVFESALREVGQEAPSAVARTATTEGGAFTLGGLVAHATYRVTAIAPPPLLPRWHVCVATPDALGSVTLRLERGTPLRLRLEAARGVGKAGRVSIAPRGRGAIDLVYEFTASGDGEWGLSDVPTGLDGELRLPAVPSGPLAITAVVPGEGAVTRELDPSTHETGAAPGESVVVVSLRNPDGGILEGTVRDAEGRAVPGALLAWEGTARVDRVIRVARAGAAGRFRIEGLPPGRVKLQRAFAPDLRADQVELLRWSHTNIRAGATTEVDVRLGPISTVTGIVRDAALAPVAHAEVSLRSASGHVESRTRTGSDGRFSFEAVPLGSGWVTVDGLEAAERGRTPVDPSYPGATAPFELTASRGSVSIELTVKAARLPPLIGTVVDDSGSTVEGAVVTAERWLSNGESTPTRSVRSDVAGRFSIDLPAPGPRWGLSATAGARRSPREVVHAGTGPVTLTLSPELSSLSGTIVDSGGAPMAGAAVTPFAPRTGWIGNGQDTFEAGAAVSTDADGRFTLKGLGAGSIMLGIQHRGLHFDSVEGAEGGPDGKMPGWFELVPGAEVKDVRVVAPRTGAIAGTVVDAAGTPVAGATIYAWLLDQRSHERPRRVIDRTDSNGSFHALYLREGTYEIGFEDQETQPTQVRTGTLDVRIVRPVTVEPVRARRTLRGTVVGPDGTKIALARLEAGGSSRIVEGVPLVVDGQFEIVLEAHEAEVRLDVQDAVDRNGTRVGTGSGTFPIAPEQREPLVLTLDAARIASGRVVNAGGLGVPDVLVTFRRLDGFGFSDETEIPSPWTLTAADGGFRLNDLPSGELALRVCPEGDWVEPEQLPLGEGSHIDLRVTMVRGARIRGLATNEEGTATEASISVTWTEPSLGKPTPVPTGPDGKFLLVVPSDAKHVRIRAEGGPPGFPAAMRRRFPFAVARDVPPGTTDLVLRMTRGEIVNGTVVGPGGEPIATGWVKVLAEAEDPEPTESLLPREPLPFAQIRDGAFELREVPNGRRRLVAIPDSDEFAPSEAIAVEVPGGPVPIIVPSSVEREVRFTPSDGRAYFVTWQGSAADGTTVWRTATTDADGRCKLRLPPTGRGVLYARRTDADRFALAKDVSGNTTETLTLPLQDGLSIAGRVEGLAAGEGAGGTVILIGPDVRTANDLRADGTFEIRGLPAGNYRVEVEIPAAFSFAFATSAEPPRVPAGTRDAVISTGIRRVQRR